jgi:hypothetical protein
MAKKDSGPTYSQKVRDEKRGDEIRKDNRGIVQTTGGLSFLLLISGFFFERLQGFIEYLMGPLIILVLLSLLYFGFQTVARLINLPLDGIKKLIKIYKEKKVNN